MNYEEALELVKKEVHIDGYMWIKCGSHFNVVVPHKEGMVIINALRNAQKFEYSYSPQYLMEIDSTEIEINYISIKQYQRHKLAELLQVSVEDVKTSEKAFAHSKLNKGVSSD